MGFLPQASTLPSVAVHWASSHNRNSVMGPGMAAPRHLALGLSPGISAKCYTLEVD